MMLAPPYNFCLRERLPPDDTVGSVIVGLDLPTSHIIDIAQYFNKFYHDEHILVDDEAERQAKLSVVYAAKQTIANGLKLLGIGAPEKM